MKKWESLKIRFPMLLRSIQEKFDEPKKEEKKSNMSEAQRELELEKANAANQRQKPEVWPQKQTWSAILMRKTAENNKKGQGFWIWNILKFQQNSR